MTKEYIERGALLKDIEESVVFSVRNAPSAEMRGANKIMERIKGAPAADVVEVKHGRLTVQALAAMTMYTDIKVMSAYNGKLLCKKFNPKKHPSVADREVSCIWAEINASKSMCFGNIALPVLCVYVNGAKEYAEERNRREGKENADD